uniref:ubiquitinyl hydrolase 1 n=1 Tax=Corethron hystrix TaxID=216773 RepID=A0A7S1C243_9STRA|mmetsp:Transcript_9256/g.20450  ORF Transcript_9256/g.20450 Transcript_9256/m.20450 type:complete len:357 (+) Transcript_9256:92-1162(+)|eukprot:CAMPEP_0113298084 /NCGR_PEP_ID=MMETSP0010_2-20120614/675_1 /TAXON_ID=216773 ORGANISM="Corethron hystrix, Strain 308" /NCGR_SAMPLE_ID=MMETSP0010_2 /ASSEMBLY_ACC=CAM_ASM_000155 /LENGTH=356 /DNA_ID=CAMNT_0000151077 /DNA_START=28 /DNA_END=1098 /DNA_ORIENTATION=+ /assembly_acc=CAM_ASM_000155
MDGVIWIYHERQVAALCGQHALNNLCQTPSAFSVSSLAHIAEQLDAVEMTYMAQNNEGGTRSKDYLKRLSEGSGNVDEAGNFSIQVLRAALENRYGLSLPNIQQKGVGDSVEVTELEGFICNRHSHWFAIRKINGRFWNLDSTKERPEQISHFKLATEIEGLQNGGYSVFCVIDGPLPPASTTMEERSLGNPEYWWNEAHLVKGNGVNGTADPWKNVGSGTRLDGKTSSNSSELDNLSEEEMMQMAINASIQSTIQTFSAKKEPDFQLRDEPPMMGHGIVRLQFRLPRGGRPIQRRFFAVEDVGVLYSFVKEQGPYPPGKTIDLLAGFPPKDIVDLRGKTIEKAGLAGETIQVRLK